MHPLVKNLLGTFVIATVIAIGVNFGFYAYLMHGSPFDTVKILLSIANGTLLLTVILSIMSIPVLFLQNVNYWNNIILRVLLYFSGPVVYLIASFTQQVSDSEKKFHFITGGIFLVVHIVFYFLAVRKLGQKAVK
jgi:hypothetical protein